MNRLFIALITAGLLLIVFAIAPFGMPANTMNDTMTLVR
jgi:hypothetical protein